MHTHCSSCCWVPLQLFARRPLGPELLLYCAQDVVHLFELYNRLTRNLSAVDLNKVGSLAAGPAHGSMHMSLMAECRRLPCWLEGKRLCLDAQQAPSESTPAGKQLCLYGYACCS
jgi:hypothetical protein